MLARARALAALLWFCATGLPAKGGDWQLIDATREKEVLCFWRRARRGRRQGRVLLNETQYERV